MEVMNVPKEGDVHILFSCTTIGNESTFAIDYDQIHEKFIDFFDEDWKDKIKMTKFIIQGTNDDDTRFGIQRMENDNYVFVSPIEEVYLIDYIEQKSNKYDIVFLAQCSNLIDTFYAVQELSSLYSSNIDILNDNVEILYDQIKTNGFLMILSCGEEQSNFVDFEEYYNSDVFQSMDVYIYLTKVMNKLFEKLETGIYQKKKVKDIKSVFDECFEQVTNEILELSEHLDGAQEQVDNKHNGKQEIKDESEEEISEGEDGAENGAENGAERDSEEEENTQNSIVNIINHRYFQDKLELNSENTKQIKKNIFHLVEQILEDKEN